MLVRSFGFALFFEIFAIEIDFVNQVGKPSGLFRSQLGIIDPLDVVEGMPMRAFVAFHDRPA